MNEPSKHNGEPTTWEEVMPDVDQLQDDVEELADLMTDEQFAELIARIEKVETKLEDNAFLLRFLTSLNIGGTARDREAIKGIAARAQKARKALEPTSRRRWSSPSVATAHATVALADAVALLLAVAARRKRASSP